MIDKKQFAKMRKELEQFEEGRERVISLSRDIISLSKQIIYAVQRNDLKDAQEKTQVIKQAIKKLPRKWFDTSMSNVALQEYVEAMTFFEYCKTGKLLTAKELGVDIDNYLLGLCDLTGELGRKAVNEAIRQNFKEVEKIREVVDEIYGEFLKLNLRNGELRKKSDSIKWNLKKLEDLVYDIKVKK